MTARLRRVTVAVLTYRRGDLLESCLQALARVDRPDGMDTTFLVVDNDPAESARETVRRPEHRFGGALEYVMEQRPGIPTARNRALDEAAARGADVLCFTDDDVAPRKEWLTALCGCLRDDGAHLAFGPVRFTPWMDLTSGWQRAIARGVAARAVLLERYARRHAAAGTVVTGATSNCAVDLAWVARHGIRFDDAMRESGGSDTVFREAVRAAGGRLAWCARATVEEWLPASRLSLRYQFRRAMAHGMTTARVGRPVPYATLRSPLGRIVSGAALMVVPALGRGSFMAGLHLAGMGIGMLRARRGGRAKLYAR